MKWKKSLCLFALSLHVSGFGFPCTVPFNTWSGSVNDDWSNINNWEGVCIPELPGDQAIFAALPSATANVNVNGNFTIDLVPYSLAFQSSATSYTLSGTGTLLFDGTTPGIYVVGNQTFGTNSTVSPDIVHVANNTTLTISGGGTLNFLNAGLGPAPASANSVLIDNTNITNTNTSTVTMGFGGSIIFGNLLFTVTGGSLTNTNSGTVTNAANNGCLIGSVENMTFTNTTITETNSGTVFVGARGAKIGNDFPFGTTIVEFNNCTVNLLNTGTIIAGIGCSLENSSLGVLQSNGSIITLTNETNFTYVNPMPRESIVGCAMIAGVTFFNNYGQMEFNGGQVNFINHGDITSDNGTVGVDGILGLSENLSITNGAKFFLINTGTVTQPAGLSYANAGSSFRIVGTPISNGTVTLSDGLIVNNGLITAGALDVQSAGVVSGVGEFVGESLVIAINTIPIDVTNAGVFLPGDPGLGNTPTAGTTPGGVMTIAGNYTQTATGSLIIDILNAGAGNFSQLSLLDTVPSTASGVANLAGSLTVAFIPGSTLHPMDTFEIITTASGVSGTFSSTAFLNIPPFFTPEITYMPDSVLLSFMFQPPPPPIPPPPPPPPPFRPVVTSYPNYPGVILSTVNQLNQIIRMRKMACPPPVIIPKKKSLFRKLFFVDDPKDNVVQEEPTCDFRPCEPKGWNLYFTPSGTVGGQFKGKEDQVGFGYASYGGILGFDYTFSQVAVGLLTAYQKTRGNVHHNWGSFDINDLHVSAYSKFASDRVALLAIAGGGHQFYDIHRKAHPLKSKTKGSPQGSDYDGLLGVQYTFGPAKTQLIPQLSLQYIHASVNGYREAKGRPYNFKYHAQVLNSLRSTFGFRANYSIVGEEYYVVPEIALNWQREFLFPRRKVHFTSLEVAESQGSLVMAASGRNLFLAGFDLNAMFCNRYGIEARYNFEWNSLFHDHFISLGANWRF